MYESGLLAIMGRLNYLNTAFGFLVFFFFLVLFLFLGMWIATNTQRTSTKRQIYYT